MFDELKRVAEKAGTKGDLAVVLLAGTAGYAADLALSLTGVVSPGVLGGLAASTALGIKQGVEAGAAARKQRKSAQPAPSIPMVPAGDPREFLLKQAEALHQLLEDAERRIAAIMSNGSWRFRRKFRWAAEKAMSRAATTRDRLIRDATLYAASLVPPGVMQGRISDALTEYNDIELAGDKLLAH